MNRREFLKQAALVSAGMLFCGKVNAARSEYFITDDCTGCEQCYDVCPHQAINDEDVPLKIDQDYCSHCGRCYEICPVGAIVKR
ncbi:MAG: 4Fe-4S binding protein [Selenomonadaceae bacterium]|nr:4Fe-4S binding protein [Selenomonadaceae bacterium]